MQLNLNRCFLINKCPNINESSPGFDGSLRLAVSMSQGIVNSLAASHERGLLGLKVTHGIFGITSSLQDEPLEGCGTVCRDKFDINETSRCKVIA